MKKRKTRLLRHEWHEHHFTLRGTQLSMHEHERSRRVLESIDVDDYAVACSSISSNKLSAAMKAVNAKLGGRSNLDASNGGREDAFAFQLIPAAIEHGKKLKKRESAIGGAKPGKAGVEVKTHHFAVRSRDERIDWMRELMLAKALKARGEGYTVEVNGNLI
jgi:hypothetical protein